jgi:hypothetical protein
MSVNEHWLMNETRERIGDLQREAAHQRLVAEARGSRNAGRAALMIRPIWKFRLPRLSIRSLRPTMISNH